MEFAYYARANEAGTELIETQIDWQVMSDRLGYNAHPDLIMELGGGYVKVFNPSPLPPHDPDFENIVYDGHEFKNGRWFRKCEARQKTLHEIDTLINDAKRIADGEINRDRLIANADYFTFRGHRIASDRLSKDDIFGTNNQIQNLGGELPADWIGFWKTKGNDYLPIATVQDWKEMYAAMYDQGMENFKHAAYLKTLIKNATTLAEIRAIRWNQQSPFKRVPVAE